MPAPAVTYTFTNGTTSDASQVNTNFTNLINAMSDGTTDFSIGSLVVAGAATLNGAVTLGNSTADAITITGNISSSLTFSANATHNFGTATVAPLSYYLGNGTKSVRLMAGTVGTSWTFTFPNDVPAIAGQTMVFSTAGAAEFRYPDKFTATKTANYTATGDETVILCDPTTGVASFTVTLPAASTMTGKELTIVKIDAGLTYTVTIDGNASETILPSVQSSQLTYILYTQYESVTLKCNGTSWYVIHHQCATPWVAFPALTFGGTAAAPAGNLISGSTTAPGIGTTTINAAYWQRIGSSVRVRWDYAQTTAGTGGTGSYTFNLPAGLTMDSAVVTADTNIGSVSGTGYLSASLGTFHYSFSTNACGTGIISAYSTTQLKAHIHYSSGTSPSTNIWGSTGLTFATANSMMAIEAILPIVGWNP
jgi:hypothetical protein